MRLQADAPTPQDAPLVPKPQDCLDHVWLEIRDFANAKPEPDVILCSHCGWKRGKLVATWQPIA